MIEEKLEEKTRFLIRIESVNDGKSVFLCLIFLDVFANKIHNEIDQVKVFSNWPS